MQIPACFST